MKLLAALALLAASPAAAQTVADRIRADMATLADDGMEGRRPGTAGEARAVAAIIAMFERAGLEPGARGGWVQRIALEERRPVRARLTVAGRDLASELVLVGERRTMRLRNAPIRFVGYADAVPRSPGAILLYYDKPAPGSPLTPGNDAVGRSARLAASGAAMALAISDDRLMTRYRTRVPQGMIERARAARPPIRGYITEAAAEALQTGEATADVEVVTASRRFASANVVGRLRGATLPDEAVLFSAHWDALGICASGASDAICNGAVDNASGAAGMVELARRFAASPRTDRSLLFVASTAEEYGLLGMLGYAADPVVPLAKTALAINVDTIPLYPAAHPVGFVGAGLTDLDPLIAGLVAAQGRALDPGEGASFVVRNSDAWPMLRAGVPAVILSNTIAWSGPDKGARFRDMIATRLHLPVDDMRDIDLSGAIADLELMHALGRAVATRGTWPAFVPTARFSRPASPRARGE